MTAAQDSRAQFEKWARRCCYDIERAGGGEQYKSNITEQVWLSWQASRAALPAEPVARTPLSFEQIEKWWASENGLEDCDMAKRADFVQVVRAVEAAHGITQEKQG